MCKLLKFLVTISFVSRIISQECGRSTFGAQFSVGGEYSEVGQWPWLAPLFLKDGERFFCGSNIISNQFLLTAAHCIQRKSERTHRSPNTIYASLGRFDLNKTNEIFAKRADIETVYVHPEWSFSALTFDGDVALLKTVTKITFTDHIKPVCLPSSDSAIFNVNGFVAGYGKSEENAVHETKPKHVRIRSVTQEVCLFSDPIFVRISSPRMFCAGEKAKNPCRGDSGSGWFVRSGNAYQIIGIVSAAVSEECAANHYVIFTSVPKFMDWIEQYVKSDSSRCKRHATCNVEDDFDGPKCTIANSNFGHEQNCRLIIDDQSNDRITKLNLIGSSMEYVPDITSAVQKFKSLHQFDAGWAGIKEIARRDLSVMKDFSWISFWGNKLEEIPSNAFNDLIKLDKLILGDNKLRSLHPDLFAYNIKLRELWLNSNQLEVLPKGLFRNNKELAIIYADKNKLTTIKVDFLALPKFQLITFQGNVCIEAWCEVGDYCGTGSKEEMQRKILLDC